MTLLENTDVTESEEQLQEFFDPSIQGQLKDQLMAFTRSEPPSRLDRVLLKGYYTNDRVELENP